MTTNDKKNRVSIDASKTKIRHTQSGESEPLACTHMLRQRQTLRQEHGNQEWLTCLDTAEMPSEVLYTESGEPWPSATFEKDFSRCLLELKAPLYRTIIILMALPVATILIL